MGHHNISKISKVLPPNQNCEYRINAPPGWTIKLTFTYLWLEYVRGCFYDFVQIYYGNTKEREIARFCGIMRRRRYYKPFHSTGSKVIIVFKSDYSRQRRGFRIQVTFRTNLNFEDELMDD